MFVGILVLHLSTDSLLNLVLNFTKSGPWLFLIQCFRTTSLIALGSSNYQKLHSWFYSVFQMLLVPLRFVWSIVSHKYCAIVFSLHPPLDENAGDENQCKSGLVYDSMLHVSDLRTPQAREFTSSWQWPSLVWNSVSTSSVAKRLSNEPICSIAPSPWFSFVLSPVQVIKIKSSIHSPELSEQWYATSIVCVPIVL